MLWALVEGYFGRRLALWTSWRIGDELRPGVWERGFEIKWEPRDLWIGLYYTGEQASPRCGCPDAVVDDCLDFYLCVVPTLVFHLYFRRRYAQ